MKLPVIPKLGVEFPTAWSRKWPARAGRKLMITTVTRPVISLIARPEVVGADRLQHFEGTMIFAANHSSHLDTSILISALPGPVRKRIVVAARSDYFFDKYWKAFIWTLWINVVPIDREKVSRKTIKLISHLIESGWNLIIYPEATRGDDDFIEPFRPGAAYLATHTDALVIPTYIDGARRIYPPYKRKLRPGRTRVVFGKPLRVNAGEKSRDFNERIEQAVAAAADEGRTDWWSARRRAAKGKTPSLAAPEGVEGWRRTWAATAPQKRRVTTPWPL